ncbi:uncharacterized protein GIQ15_03398 [Arthroderma uncinatum]|uniref:uncharacterized protein n=1 Tax=Arthroderma uncinatum TaxID=74035 RepID=UPI00144AA3FE|nr:uncharacterized protein GIQ15_03398 [Arthroderma uncinatum]KAF3484074.1 hypothetical protein GIQ15_03398 [Arthroderma uncinatum]
MAVFLFPVYCLGWLLLLACSRAMNAPTPTYPQTVEVDLIFPRNETYAPVPLTPFVFAVQNFHVSKPLYLHFSYSVEQDPYIDAPSAGGHLYLDKANFSSSDPYFIYGWTPKLNNTEATWRFIWEWSAGNCSRSKNPVEPLEFGSVGRRNIIHFTTKNGAKQLDLVAATQDGTCDKSQAHTLNITEVLDVPSGTRYYNNQPLCPLLSTITPTPDPCGAKIDSAAASSISYAIQSSACIGGASPNVTCPPGVEPWSSARRTTEFSTGAVLLVATVAWLIHMI